ncbi:MAG: hypothetical protein JXA09_17320 [Anaerolineae bacterium]|nr:hypothetical protein [Anaerolineae bacterium]
MSASVFDALEERFSHVVPKMGKFFDSHDFILAIAQIEQQLYIRALAAYADHEYPFQIVHGEIARRLSRHPELVVKVGETNSEDIFHRKGSAVVWRKVE